MTPQELQSLRNLGGECETAADEIDRLHADLAVARAERDEAIAMLADWCVRVDIAGTQWDDWDEGYKNAAYRPCGIRALLDAAIRAELELAATYNKEARARIADLDAELAKEQK